MIRFLIKRLFLMLLTMVAASFLIFAVSEFYPGTVARKSLGPYALQSQVDLLYQKLQLNDPLVIRYVRWAGVLLGIKRDPLGDPELGLGFTDKRGHKYFGNFGYSPLYKEAVNDFLWDRLKNSMMLAGLAFAAILPLSIIFGTLAGISEGSKQDRALTFFSVLLTSIPDFAMGVFLIAIFVVALHMLPGAAPLETGSGWSIGAQLVLPVLVLTLYDFGYVARIMRSSIVEVMTQPYIRTAVLKGLPYHRVVLVHALRNAMIVPFAVLMLQVNWLLTGVVVTETLFGYPGFGRTLLQAALFGDFTLLEATTLVAVLIAVGTQLVGDIGYMLINPRIRLS